jgi:pyrimidine operon attenuation protein/uracil phosphoribosyltransferase
MATTETRLKDAQGLDRLLASLAGQIAGNRWLGAPLSLIGVRTRGVPIAQRIAALLQQSTGSEVYVGAVDITLYRDDLSRGERWPVLLGTDIPFDVEGAEIVLIDDVLYTGRTVRAALNAVCDLGRPACVRLAALVDRGGRELPIRPDYVGMEVDASPEERILVRVSPPDPTEEIVRQSGSARL